MVIGWLTRITAALAVLFVLGYDAIALTASHIGAVDDANQAATAAADSWHDGHNLQAAVDAADKQLTSTETLVPGSVRITTDGSVSLQVHRVTATLVAKSLPKIKDWTSFTVAGSAPAPTS